MSHVCAPCSLIIAKTLKEHIKGSDYHPSVKFHPKRYLRQVQKRDCHLCSIFYDRWQQVGWGPDRLETRVEHAEPNAVIPCDLSFLWSSDDDLRFTVVPLDPEAYGGSVLSLVDQQRRAALVETIDGDSGSEASLKIARTWLEECHQAHDPTPAANSFVDSEDVHTWMPSRLLDAGETSDAPIRLLNGADAVLLGRYMTLSHCWGKKHHIRLTSENEADLRSGVPLSALPKTFADALLVTRSLGFRLLWIDALCIMQDSQEDWQNESVLMAQIYQNAHCNLLASDAADDSGGLFYQYNRKLVEPMIVDLVWSPTAYDELGAQVALIPELRSWEKLLEKRILYERAWVVQERLLARRNLHFTRDGILFECAEDHAHSFNSLFVQGDFHHPRTHQTRWGFDVNLPPARAILRGQSSEVAVIDKPPSDHDQYLLSAQLVANLRSFSAIIQIYKNCRLTFRKDKHIAFAGLAKVLLPKFEGPCYAGHFNSTLPWSLLWFTSSSKIAGEEFMEQPVEQEAPTWSWASADGPIRPAWIPDAVIEYAERNRIWHLAEDWRGGTIFSNHVQKIDFHPHQKLSVFPFYPGIRLSLRGSVREVLSIEASSASRFLPDVRFDVPSTEADIKKQQVRRKWYARLKATNSAADVPHASFRYFQDSNLKPEEDTDGLPKKIFCLILGLTLSVDQPYAQGLVLKRDYTSSAPQRSGDPMRFRRIGKFDLKEVECSGCSLRDAMATFEEIDLELV